MINIITSTIKNQNTISRVPDLAFIFKIVEKVMYKD